MNRLMYVVTHSRSARLLEGQLTYMREQGFQVCLVSSPGSMLREIANREGVDSFEVLISREINLIGDCKSLIALLLVMLRWRPDIVNAGTPKAGTISMLAAFIARIPVRIYTLRGLRLETTRGVKRFVLRCAELVASSCAHIVIPISKSLACKYVSLGLVDPHKINMLGSGSSNGVDWRRFAYPEKDALDAIRESLNDLVDLPVVGFVGRITRDKGVPELLEAFESVVEMVPYVKLLLVGSFESGDPIPSAVVERIHDHPGIIYTGRVADTAPYYSLIDVLAFPSHREGFGNVVLEASAAGVPVVGFRATGTLDAVVDGVTGTLVELGDTDGLANALSRYLLDEELRREHGLAGQQRARDEFIPCRIWENLLREYQRLLGEHSGRENI